MGDVYIKPVPVALGGDVLKPTLIARPAPSRAEIAQWEAGNGRLPDDYIAFMMGHNGGTIAPQMFQHNTDDPTEFLEIGPETGVDVLFTWDMFETVNATISAAWRAEHVAIGYDYSSSHILLSLRPQDFGAVRYWWRNNGSWDDFDGPVPIGDVAPSFRSFIFEKIYEHKDGTATRWDLPQDLATAAKVNF
ncbi:MAG: SMI1/KNR4 family protein [Paracoccaceae bacterium]